MAYGSAAPSLRRVLFSFIAGFLATLIFHQLTLAALWAAGMARLGLFRRTQPIRSACQRYSRWHSGMECGESYTG